MTYIFALLALVVAWNLAPMLMLCTLPIPWRHKLRGCKSFAGAALRGLLVLPPDLLAPVVVPFALRRIGWGLRVAAVTQVANKMEVVRFARESAPLVPDSACLTLSFLSTATSSGVFVGQFVQEVAEA